MAVPDFDTMLADFVPADALASRGSRTQQPATAPPGGQAQAKPDQASGQGQGDNSKHPELKKRTGEAPGKPMLAPLPGSNSALEELARQSELNLQKEHEDIKNALADSLYLEPKMLWPPTGSDAEKLNRIIGELGEAVPGSIPEAKNLPAQPDIYIFDNGYRIGFYTPESGKAAAIAVPKEMLDNFSPGEVKAAVAHDYSHWLIKQNPEMLENYHPRDHYGTQREMDALRKNDKKAGMSEYDKEISKSIYINESAADDIAVRLTRDPETYKAMMKHITAIADKQTAQDVQAALQDDIELAKRMGHPLTDKQVKEKERELELTTKISDPHPSGDLRVRQAHIEGHQLGITKETLIEHVDDKVLELLHLHGGSAAQSTPDATANPSPKPLNTPATSQPSAPGSPQR